MELFWVFARNFNCRPYLKMIASALPVLMRNVVLSSLEEFFQEKRTEIGEGHYIVAIADISGS